MTPEQCAALMTYANQIDARIQLNDPTLDAWWSAVERLDYEAAKWSVKDYYATSNPNSNFGTPALVPATLRARVHAEIERNAARQRALEPPAKHTNPMSYRERNPEEFNRLMKKGRDDHRADLTRRGIPLTEWQTANDSRPTNPILQGAYS
ncbi:hypothetical protein FQ154_01755 [Paeniglutamicibacter gangotriensis]|uniref:Replicative helicase inhibitor G39P N-terminal domain-containing protein n=1 Tax=Paeniglutamicibacter gangotriensis TaxID=254787 RepID=A0A5B0EQC0_9MICC|nr:hypothetical protein [Paeniglutamicibacter gangotriensis]KAA0979910.1 hypothetical protein FQ154_01755 [Paeniglutamicibacter gangotriensis]